MNKEKKEEKYCGNCCWFYGEMTDGEGMCIVHQFDDDDLPWYCCTMSACADYVSRQEMRHHMAVLLRQKRWMDDDMFIHYAPDGDEVSKAIGFTVQYMKVFSKL